MASEAYAAKATLPHLLTIKGLWLELLAVEAVLLLLILIATGTLSGELTPDTSGYFRFAAGQSATLWGDPRHPAYGWLASWVGASGTDTGHVAVVQALLHVIAPFILCSGARRGGIGAPAAFALATAALLSQAGFLNVGAVMPESPANSFLLMAFGGALAASGSARAFRLCALPIALAAGAAYMLRPSHLPAMVIIPALYWVFARRNGGIRPALQAALLLLLVAVPFVAQSAVRLKAVGDFNLVSFGGFQMSPMAAFMLTPDVISRLPERVQPTARDMLAARETAQREGVVPRTPLDRPGDRFFITTAYGYFDIYARGYDTLLQHGIAKLQRPDESFVAFNKRLLEVSVATVMAAPFRWAVWVGGATARLVGRAIATNLPMLVSIALLLILSIPAFIWRRDLQSSCGIGATGIVALAWFASTGALTVLITFPATRYIDTAATLLPAVPLALAIALIVRLRTPDEPKAT